MASVVAAVGSRGLGTSFSVPIAIAAPAAANDVIAIATGSSLSTPTDNAGGTWSLIQSLAFGLHLYRRNEKGAGGPTSVTLAGSSGGVVAYSGLWVLEISGLDATPLDSTPNTKNTATGTSISAADITTASNGSLGIAGVWLAQNVAAETFTGPGGDWVEVLTNASPASGALYYDNDLGTAGTKSFSGVTIGTSLTWHCQLVALEASYPVNVFGLRA